MSASEFKAKCLAVLDRVRSTGHGVVITKHGKPAAEVVPLRETRSRFPQEDLAGTVQILGDVVSPALPEDVGEALEAP